MPFSPEERARLRSIGHLPRGRTMARSTSGRDHPESGMAYKTTTDELGHQVTEHGEAGTGLSERQDVMIHADPVNLNIQTGGE